MFKTFFSSILIFIYLNAAEINEIIPCAVVSNQVDQLSKEELNKQLRLAIKNKENYKIINLIDKGADPNSFYKWQPLLWYSFYQHKGSFEVFDVLLNKGADINIIACGHNLAMDILTRSQPYSKAINHLITRGLNVNKLDSYGRNLLLIYLDVIVLHYVDFELIKLLFLTGINIRINDKDGKNAFYRAMYHKPLEQLLIDYDDFIIANSSSKMINYKQLGGLFLKQLQIRSQNDEKKRREEEQRKIIEHTPQIIKDQNCSCILM